MGEFNSAVLASVAGLIVLVLGAVGYGLRDIITAIFQKWTASYRRRQYAHGIQKLALFHEGLQIISQMPSVDRVTAFRGRNSGGLPAPGVKYYVEPITSYTERGLDASIHTYAFELKVDTHYLNILSRLVNEEKVLVLTADMPDGSQMKTLHANENAIQSAKYFISVDGVEMLFVSVVNGKGAFTPAELNSLEMCVERLRSIYNS